MKNKPLSEAEAIALCNTQESHFFDKKSFRIEPRDIEKHAVAFANAEGGDLIIGIEDDIDPINPLKAWSGYTSIEDYNKFLQSLYNLSPSLEMEPSFLSTPLKDEIILKITIEKGNKVYKTSSNKVYIRKGAQSLPVIDPDKITELSYAKGSTSYEDEKVPDIAIDEVVDSNQIRIFLNSYSPLSESLDFVLNQNLVDLRTWDPRVAGILLFSDLPQNKLPKKMLNKSSPL